MPKVELMGQIWPNLKFLLVVDPKTIFFWFYEKSLSGRVFSRHVRFSTRGHERVQVLQKNGNERVNP